MMEFRKMVPEDSNLASSCLRKDKALQNDNRIRLLAAMAACLMAFAAPLLAQAPAAAADDVPTKVAALEASVKAAQSAGDNAWMLVSSALVLMMTGPGL